MSTAAVPRPAGPVSTGSSPVPRHSEATRLLCAGTYLDPEFRRGVLRELVEHRERAVAPSLGVDVVTVLGHALRSRRRETVTALGVLAVWAAFILFSTVLSDSVPYADLTVAEDVVPDVGLRVVGDDVPDMTLPTFANAVPDAAAWASAYALPSLLLWAAAVAGGRAGFDVYGAGPRTAAGRLRPRRVRLGRALRLLGYVYMAVYWFAAVSMLPEGAWTAVVFPLLLVCPVWAHRTRIEKTVRDELSANAFPSAVPPGLPAAYHGIAAAIAHEQYSRLTIYDFDRPFVGYGVPYEPWSLAVELKRRPGGSGGETLTSRRVIELILPRLAALRDATAAGSRDRLKDLEVAHLVYLPPPPRGGDVRRDDATVDQHVRGAVDEGGEARRYFLRIRVGAWSEQVVVTILVRVHTQGGMLVLEVVPHVLSPVRPEFREVDRLALRGSGVRTLARSVLTAPSSSIAAVVSMGGTLASVFRTWLADLTRRPAEGPATSVRELAVSPKASLFQEMDVSRYVKTVRDRIASGVTEALRESGHETGEFEQYVVNVNEGGVYIGAMSGGAVASGPGATATQRGDGAGPGRERNGARERRGRP